MDFERKKRNEIQRKWNKANPEKIRAIKKRWYEKNKEKVHAERRRYRAENRVKIDAAKRAWEQANPEMVSMQRARRRIKAMNAKISGGLSYHYGITLEKYNEVLAMQGGCCVICGGKQEGYSKTARLFVDHDHNNGKLRSLLCHFCNAGLGYFKERLDLFRRAMIYLEAFNGSDEKDWTSRVRQVLDRLSEEGCEIRRDESVCEDRPVAGIARPNAEGASVAEDAGAMA